MGASSVPGSHVAVALSDGATDAEVTVLAVHVVYTRAGLVTQPDAKVLDLHWTPLWNFLEFL